MNKVFVDCSGASVTPWGLASQEERKVKSSHRVAIYLRESEATAATPS